MLVLLAVFASLRWGRMHTPALTAISWAMSVVIMEQELLSVEEVALVLGTGVRFALPSPGDWRRVGLVGGGVLGLPRLGRPCGDARGHWRREVRADLVHHLPARPGRPDGLRHAPITVTPTARPWDNSRPRAFSSQ
jgi:hypothetical protein